MAQKSNGFSLVELMVAVGIGMTMSLAAAGLVSDMTKSNAQVRSSIDYVNFANSVKIELERSSGCSATLGSVVYVNTVDTDLPSITVSGSPILVGTKIPGTQLTLDRAVILASEAPTSAQLSDGGVLTSFKRYVTRLRIEASKSNAAPIRPVSLTLTLFTYAANDQIRFCSGSDTTASCVQMGGVYMPGNPLSTPPVEDRCDILPAFGGCAKGGTYSTSNGSCSAGNPYTGGCSCGAGYTQFTIGSFSPSKGANYAQYECLRCSPNVNPNNNPGALTPIYDEDAIENELYCAQNITICQACQTNPNSQACICGRDPTSAACTSPSACTTYGQGSCPCMQERMTILCGNNPNSPQCVGASNDYLNTCGIIL